MYLCVLTKVIEEDQQNLYKKAEYKHVILLVPVCLI